MEHKQQIQMAVFDWAGTTVDYGSSAPADVFQKVFQDVGIHFTPEEINGPMGTEKKKHIRSLLQTETGTSQWKKTHGRDWTEADVDALYETFEHELFRVVASYSNPLAGVVETIGLLRGQGLKIGSTTGYTSEMMEHVIPTAKAQGYEADCVITPDQVGSGRPGPFMLFECMRRLNVYPPCTVVKVGDTAVDMLEGKNAGAFSIGVLTGSSAVGLTEEEYKKASAEEIDQRKKAAEKLYFENGADLVIDSILDLPEAIAKLNQRLTEKEQ